MTLKDLKIIYDNNHNQVGDTDKDFYEWAVAYLLNKETEHKDLVTQIKRHLGEINKDLKKLG